MPCAALKITIFDVTMKPFCIILLIILTSSNSFAQDYNLSLGAEYSENFAFRNYSGQLLFELPVGDNFTLNYKFLIGGNSDRAFYVHAPIGAASGAVLMKELGGANTKIINTLGVLLMIIPEGVTFYPNPDNDVRVGIYVSPLGSDYWYKRSNYEYFRLSGEAGGKVKFPLGKDDRFDIILHGGVKYLYSKKAVDPFFINGGIAFGVNF